jgi:hypothetical protein
MGIFVHTILNSFSDDNNIINEILCLFKYFERVVIAFFFIFLVDFYLYGIKLYVIKLL